MKKGGGENKRKEEDRICDKNKNKIIKHPYGGLRTRTFLLYYMHAYYKYIFDL